MRAFLLPLLLFLASCASAQETSCEDCPQEGDVIKRIELILDEPAPVATEPVQPCVSEAFDADALFLPQPATWIPLATQLFGCAPEAIALLELGSEELLSRDAEMSSYEYRADQEGQEGHLMFIYVASAAMSVSLATDTPADAPPDLFEAMLEQARGIEGAEVVVVRDGSAWASVPADVPYTVMFRVRDQTVTLSVLRDDE